LAAIGDFDRLGDRRDDDCEGADEEEHLLDPVPSVISLVERDADDLERGQNANENHAADSASPDPEATPESEKREAKLVLP
jgi:hypothetical protein